MFQKTLSEKWMEGGRPTILLRNFLDSANTPNWSSQFQWKNTNKQVLTDIRKTLLSTTAKLGCRVSRQATAQKDQLMGRNIQTTGRLGKPQLMLRPQCSSFPETPVAED